MAKRFGRNQKRALKAELTAARMDAIRAGEVVEAVEERRRLEVEELSEQVRAARMARDSIRIDINSLVDPRERNIRMRARFDNMSMRGPELYAAYDIGPDEIIRSSDIERTAFVKLIGEQIAAHALEQIIRHWRAQ